MFSNTHGVPGTSVTGRDATNQFVIFTREDARWDGKFQSAALEQRVLLKKGANGLEMITAATDEVFAVLVEPKPAGVDYFYAITDAALNREMLNLTAMGLDDADLDTLALTNSRIKFQQPIFGGIG